MTKTLWNPLELATRRRHVEIQKKPRQGNITTCTFDACIYDKRRIYPDTTIVSCIYWFEKNEFYITSTDCIRIFEVLSTTILTSNDKKTVRHFLNVSPHITLTQHDPTTVDFFKMIRSFKKPMAYKKGQKIKVFPWKNLDYIVLSGFDRLQGTMVFYMLSSITLTNVFILERIKK
jgi:hypothetical protein